MKSCLLYPISWFYIFLSSGDVVESFQPLSGSCRSRTTTTTTTTTGNHVSRTTTSTPRSPIRTISRNIPSSSSHTKWILLHSSSQHHPSSTASNTDHHDDATQHPRKNHKNIRTMDPSHHHNHPHISSIPSKGNRRTFLHSIITNTAVTTWIGSSNLMPISPANAIVENNNVVVQDMKTFIDPKGLFIIQVPKRFFAIRRTVKGDLPDETTGKGRRGSSIFTAGDMAKAEVIAIERFPTIVLLEEEGILPSGDLTNFPAIGKSETIAELIASRRDRERQSNNTMRSNVIPGSVKLYEDGKTLEFELSTEIDVQKPDLLLEQTGMDRLVRKTLAKATLNSNDGQMMAVFASALSQDWSSEDGVALKIAVDTFMATDQSLRRNE
jgi:hypothetical protein